MSEKVTIGWPDERPQAEPDPAGWLCTDTKRNLDKCLADNPKTIVEIGSWLGKSSRYLADNSDAIIYCLDTWKGSKEHHHPKHAHKLPLLWETYCVNNWHLKERIIPIRGMSIDGLEHLYREGIDVDFFYVDGSHEYEDVIADLRYINQHWPKAKIVGDDYKWSGVQSAVHQFAKESKRRMWVQGQKSWAFLNDEVQL